MMALTPDGGGTQSYDEAACAWLRNYSTVWSGSIVHIEDRGHASFMWLIVLGGVVSAALALLLLWGLANRVLTTVRQVRRDRAEMLTVKLTRIQHAVDCSHKCEFPMCVVSLEKFLVYGEMLAHETVRDSRHGDLTWLDQYDGVVAFSQANSILFVSHQWLGDTHPDPDGVHYDATCKAAFLICERFQIAPYDLHLWVDFVSVPQRNHTSKQNAIQSLSVFANHSRFFVAVCPATNRDSGKLHDAISYMKRGWCRLEMWAMMSKFDGLSCMYLFENGALHRVEDRPAWYKEAMHVFDGDFKNESDKLALVDPVLGLWARLLRPTLVARKRRASQQGRWLAHSGMGVLEQNEEDDIGGWIGLSTQNILDFFENWEGKRAESNVIQTDIATPPTNNSTGISTGTDNHEADRVANLHQSFENKHDESGSSTSRSRAFRGQLAVDEALANEIFPAKYFGDLTSLLEQHVASGEIVWPTSRPSSSPEMAAALARVPVGEGGSVSAVKGTAAAVVMEEGGGADGEKETSTIELSLVKTNEGINYMYE